MTDNGEPKAPVVAGMLVWAARFVNRLKEGKIGDEFTQDELQGIGQIDCSSPYGKGRRQLRTAIRHLERSCGLCWQWVRGESKVRCLSCQEALDRVTAKRHSIGRQSRRSIRQLDTYDTNGLPAEQCSEVRRVGAQMGMLDLISSDKATKRLADKQVTKPLDLGRLLENLTAT